jgi:hypothetical protein
VPLRSHAVSAGRSTPEHCRDILRDPLPWDHLANYLTVILHRDIGFPFPVGLPSRHKVSDTEKGVVPLTNSPDQMTARG